MEDNKNTQQPEETSGAKLFTQDQLDAIVKKRLKEEKAKNETAIMEREKILAAKELELDARAMLAEKHLPQELLPAINCKDKETMENSVMLLVNWMLKGKAPAAGSGSLTENKAAGIRHAMGL